MGGLGSNEGGVGEGRKWRGLIQFSHLYLGRILMWLSWSLNFQLSSDITNLINILPLIKFWDVTIHFIFAHLARWFGSLPTSKLSALALAFSFCQVIHLSFHFYDNNAY
jgi:polyferredoxin